MIFFQRVAFVWVCLALALSLSRPPVALAADWQDQLSPPTPGGFPPPRPQTATYRCGWSGVSAAQLSLSWSLPKNSVIRLEASGGTTGLARTLWRLDATHTALANVATLRPISMRQLETYRSETLRTELDFTDAGVVRFRESKPADKTPPRRKRLDFPNLYDLHSAVLFVRSQKLQPGQTFSFVVYPTTAPYLATVRVLGRENIKVRAGTFPAIKFDIKLRKITKELQLEPYAKFQRANAWFSDDADRLVLKIESDIFVGSVWTELERVRFAGR